MPKSDRDTEFVTRLDDEFIMCRTIRHAYRLTYFGQINRAPEDLGIQSRFMPSTLVRQMVCDRCKVIREDFFSPMNLRGVLSNEFNPFYKRYRYHPRYSWSSKETEKDRPIASDYNLELYKRIGEMNG